MWKPIIERVNPSAECIFVAFDLKTTSLSTESSIAQIVSTFQEKSFSVYILPSKPFTKEASNVTRLSMVEDKSYHRGTEVGAVGLEKGLKQLIAWCSLFGSKLSCMLITLGGLTAEFFLNRA